MRFDRPITLRDLFAALAFALLTAAAPNGNGSPAGAGGGGGGTVTSVTAGDTSVTVGGTATDPTVRLSLTQPNANTWSGLQTLSAGLTVNGAAGTFNAGATVAGAAFNVTDGAAFSGAPTSVAYNASGTDCSPIVPAELCIVGTSVGGIVVGPQSGSQSATASGSFDSQHVYLCRQVGGTPPVVTCPGGIFMTSGGNLTLATSSSIVTSNSAFSSGTGNLTHGKDIMGADCSFTSGISGAMPAGTSACKITIPATPFVFTLTYPSAYTNHGDCAINDENRTAGSTTHDAVATCGTGSAVITGNQAGDIIDFVLRGG